MDNNYAVPIVAGLQRIYNKNQHLTKSPAKYGTLYATMSTDITLFLHVGYVSFVTNSEVQWRSETDGCLVSQQTRHAF
jgi:hypothetical protein